MPKKSKKKGKGKGKKGKKKAKKSDKEESPQFDPNEFLPKSLDWVIISFCLVPWEAQSITMFLNFDSRVTTKLTIQGLHRIINEKVGNTDKVMLYFDPPEQNKPISADYDRYRLFELGFQGGPYMQPKRALMFFDFQPSQINVLDPTGIQSLGSSSSTSVVKTFQRQLSLTSLHAKKVELQRQLSNKQNKNSNKDETKKAKKQEKIQDTKPQFNHIPSLREQKLKSPVAMKLTLSPSKYDTMQKQLFTFKQNHKLQTKNNLNQSKNLYMDPVLLTEPAQVMLEQSSKIKQEATEFIQMIRTQSKGHTVKLGLNGRLTKKPHDENQQQQSEAPLDEPDGAGSGSENADDVDVAESQQASEMAAASDGD